MTREIIHFAHANSFPAQTYRRLFALLAEDFEIGYLERHGHNPHFPVTNGWRELANELRLEIERRYTKPIIGIGHSLGGILHFLVAVENPHLYKSIFLLDAPLVGRLRGTALRTIKKIGWVDKFSPSGVALKRRREWSSKAEAVTHFARKFPHFETEVLRDYVEFGTTATENGVTLTFNPQIEAEIYRTIPDKFTQFRGKLKIPIGYIGGTNSREAKLAGLSFMKKNFSVQFKFIEGSHLFPFENPVKTALAIREMLREIP